MSVQGRVIVVGGGIIGALSAWYLRQSGREVTIIDQSKFGAACSHGNCGYVSPSHVLPLARPGAIATALRGMLGPDNPFTIRPRLSPALWSWLWRFARRCNTRDMHEAGLARHALLQSSRQLYEQLISEQHLACEWQTGGLWFVHKSREHFEQYAATDQMLRERFGVGGTPVAADELLRREPALKPGVSGAWLYECDAWLRPDRLMSELRRVLETAGVDIVEDCSVNSFVREGGAAIAVRTSAGDLSAGDFVVATGSWTPFLNRHLGCRVRIQPGKGYSITMPRPERCPKMPMIFEEHRVAVTPMQSGYRIGSTMEFAGYDKTINHRRLALLKRGAEHYLQEPYCEPVQEEWYGWRPMTADGKPYIDRSPVMPNVVVAAGHNMLGLSMGAGTGRLVSELVNQDEPHLDPTPYSFRHRG